MLMFFSGKVFVSLIMNSIAEL